MKIFVNKKVLNVQKGVSILQACREGGVEIPRFCYHERLKIAGNCRMCLVEVEKSMKPVASCAMPVMDNMQIYTNTIMVKKAREGVMELLLANHPLDCPICDQGGECDLQDQAITFGSDRGRFYEVKRAVVDKNCGVFVKTIMTRCIHCTRCVRFSSDLAGIGDFGVTGRGNKMEIGMYISKIFVSEVSGNIIDLCPVGALTSKPFAYVGRSWELESIESIDILDSLGSNISFEVRGNNLVKVLPIINESLNEEWLTDKSRFSYDGFCKQRLLRPLEYKNGYMLEVSWEEAYSKFLKEIYGSNTVIDGIIGGLVDLETIYMFKVFLSRIGGCASMVSENNGKLLNIDFIENYTFLMNLFEIKDLDFCIIIGGNLRLEMPLLLIRLRKEQKERVFYVCSLGSTVNYYMSILKIGSSLEVYLKILEGKHYICSKMINSSKTMVVLGLHSMGIYADNILNSIRTIQKLLGNGLNNLIISPMNVGSSYVGGCDLGFIEKKLVLSGGKKILYLLGSDEVEVNHKEYDYIIYQGHHGDKGILNADLVLPGLVSIEKEGLYANFQGKLQKSNLVVYGKGDVRSDWKILKSLSEYIHLSSTNLNSIINLEALRGEIYKEINVELNNIRMSSKGIFEEKISYINKLVLNNVYENYYKTDVISRASKVMVLASKKISKYVVNFSWI